MIHTIEDNLPLYSFEIFKSYHEIINYTSTRIGGVSENEFAKLNVAFHVNDKKNNVLKNRKILSSAINIEAKDLTTSDQIHETNILTVFEKEKGSGAINQESAIQKTDGLITNIKGIPLMILTADCAAVSFYDPAKKVIGIAHSGKKGTAGKIVSKMVEKMSSDFGSNPEDIIIGIGPCIYPCCYEIDLPNLIRMQLLDVGLQLENIETSGLCTSCNSNIFYSYRKEKGKTGRFGNIIMIK